MQVFVYIKPNSRHREGVLQAADGNLVVHTKAPAVDNKANLAATTLIATHYGVSKSRVKLMRGHTSKYKVFEIDKPS